MRRKIGPNKPEQVSFLLSFLFLFLFFFSFSRIWLLDVVSTFSALFFLSFSFLFLGLLDSIHGPWGSRENFLAPHESKDFD
jgi:hypothetical protein